MKKHLYLFLYRHYCRGSFVLGVDIAENADQPSLEKSYGAFKKKPKILNPITDPKSINTDGWKAKINALKNLFPAALLISCFFYIFIFISIRDRTSKKHKFIFLEVAKKMWNGYHAEKKASFSQKIRHLHVWCQNKKNKIKKSCTTIYLNFYQFIIPQKPIEQEP